MHAHAQVRYYKTLPDSVSGVRKVAASSQYRAAADYQHDAEEAVEATQRAARRRRPPPLVAAV